MWFVLTTIFFLLTSGSALDSTCVVLTATNLRPLVKQMSAQFFTRQASSVQATDIVAEDEEDPVWEQPTADSLFVPAQSDTVVAYAYDGFDFPQRAFRDRSPPLT
ncbi:MAG: hypothetical protein U0Y68_01325 [Blastocatellia bacterium]